MIGKDAIAHLKDGAVILNFARDTLVDEDALAEALKSGAVKSYVTDFATPKSTLLPNTIVLPHLGASTEEAEENCAVMAVEEMQDYLDNGNITHSVNFPDVHAGILQSEARVAILHRNIPNIISQISSFFGTNAINIDNMANKSRGAYAYTLLDIDHKMPSDTKQRLKAIEGVLRVRTL